MTAEEAKVNLEKLLLLYDDGMIDFSVIRESVKIAIEALRQMPGTSDTISRQDAIDLAYDCEDEFGKDVAFRLAHYLKQLPSAQPERKPGKWLPDNNNYYDERYVCSQCGVSYKVDTRMGKPSWSFCPNCGAKMEVEQ